MSYKLKNSNNNNNNNNNNNKRTFTMIPNQSGILEASA